MYNGELTTKCIVREIKKIKSAFPSLPSGFYDILTDRIRDLGFSDERLTDAVNNLIDTCFYPTPTIANITSWDIRVKLYNYSDIINKFHLIGLRVWDDFKAVRTPGKERLYASLQDITKFNLELI